MGPIIRPSAPPADNDGNLPESRVLIIGTGGTICMQDGPDGLQPTQGFMESAMAPRPSFNDASSPRGMSGASTAVSVFVQSTQDHLCSCYELVARRET